MSDKLSLKTTKVFRCKRFIKILAVVTGSAMSLLDEVKTDCYLTVIIKYHDAMEAKAREISY